MSSSPHSRSLAVTVVGAITIGLGAMYYARNESKAIEGPASVYRDTTASRISGRDSKVDGGPSDARMNSSDVRSAMHGTKP